MRRTSSRTSENERGQAILIIAVAMVGLLAFLALAIDGGNALTERRRAQNASDAGSLAGTRTLWVQRTQAIDFEPPVLRAINTAAEANGIEDSDGAPGNHVNTNVRAFYTDRDGNLLSGTNEVGVLGVVRPDAQGVRVVARRDFRAFIAGLIGRPNLAADAEAIAVILAPTTCGDFAIYAGCDNCSPNTLKVTGSGPTINGGGIHSNDDIHVNNMTIISGSIEYGSDCRQNCNSIAPAVQTAPTPMPQLWDIADFKPSGGSAALVAGQTGEYYSFTRNLGDADVRRDGLYYTTGDIELHDPHGDFTLVAEGEVKISGGADIRTFRYNWPLIFSNSSNTARGAVDITGDNAQWTGFIFAPNGLVSMHGANNSTLSGAIYASQVNLSGAHISINYDPAYCPLTRARIVLLK